MMDFYPFLRPHSFNCSVMTQNRSWEERLRDLKTHSISIKKEILVENAIPLKIFDNGISVFSFLEPVIPVLILFKKV
jgi:hypothetical protein